MKQYVVDAFTGAPFRGNPAAVCVMDAWPSDEWMQKLAAENRLSETASLVKEPAGWHLRWFTPTSEVELCGHATLASAFVALNFYDVDATSTTFQTQSGELAVTRVAAAATGKNSIRYCDIALKTLSAFRASSATLKR